MCWQLLGGWKQHHCCDHPVVFLQRLKMACSSIIAATSPPQLHSCGVSLTARKFCWLGARSHHRPLFVYILVFPLRCRKRAGVCVNITREPKPEPLPPSPDPKALRVFFNINLGLNASTRNSPQKSRTFRVWNKRSPTITHYSADSGYDSATCFNN